MPSLALRFYSLATTLAQPLLRRKLARRAHAEPLYLHAVDERFGHYTQAAGEGFVWVHAVSLGETRAAAILIAKLRALMPAMRLLLTNGTATGRTEGEKFLQPGDVQVWQPWDTPAAVQRFLKHFKPRVGVLMETEVWPNLVAQCHAQQVPLVLVNARLSEQSLKKAQRFASLARQSYSALHAVYAQTESDAARLKQLNAPVQAVLGNLKFDATPQAEQLARARAWRAQSAASARPVVMLASAREGEEALLLDSILDKNKPLASMEYAREATNLIANQSVTAKPRIQWLIVPRHPQRFDEVAALIESRGLRVLRRSQWGSAPPHENANAGAAIWLGDSLGEMSWYYGLSHVALLGGSFAPLGGQNLIEALACECPVLMGPHTFNFADSAQAAAQCGAAQRVASMHEAVQQASALVQNTQRLQTMQAAGSALLAASRGAAQRYTDALLQLL
jgi:3-deoxy-D-manno-octulosonic-acid transferase